MGGVVAFLDLCVRLCACVRVCQRALTEKRTLRGGPARANSSLSLMAKMPVVTSPSPLDARAELPTLLAAIDSDPSTPNSPR